jgi:tetratricopeptide (TPR) repeat protein
VADPNRCRVGAAARRLFVRQPPGSGFLVRDDLALTARHCTEGVHGQLPEAVEVIVDVDGTRLDVDPAVVLRSSPVLDVAALPLPARPVDPLRPSTYARVRRSHTGELVDCQALGFPRFNVDPRDGHHELAEVRGTIRRLDGGNTRFLTLRDPLVSDVAGSPYAGTSAEASPWAGISGAPVFFRGRILGVIIEHHPRQGGSALRISTAEAVADGADAQTRAVADALGLTTSAALPFALSGATTTTPSPTVVGDPVSTCMDTFTGRGPMRDWLRRVLLDDPACLVAIFGRRGIGKSGLAARAAADVEGAVGAVVNLSKRTTGTPLDLPRILSTTSRLLPAEKQTEAMAVIDSAAFSPIEKIRLVTGMVPHRRWVLVLDDIDHLLDESGEIVAPDLIALVESLTTLAHPPTVITTSRLAPIRPPGAAGFAARPLEIRDGLPAPDGSELLLRLDTLGQAGMAHLSDDQRQSLVRSVHGIPRALELLVNYRAKHPLTSPDALADRLLRSPSALQLLLDTTYSKLTPDELAVLRVTAAFGVPAGVDAVISTCRRLKPDTPEAQWMAVLERLTANRVLSLDLDAIQVHLHPLDADVVLRGATDSQAWSPTLAASAIADWYASVAAPQSDWQTSADAQPGVAEARHRLIAGEMTRACDLALAAARLLSGAGDVSELDLVLSALASAAASDTHRARVHLATGYVRHLTGPNTDAITALQRAVELASRVGDDSLGAEARALLTDARRYAGQLSEALYDGRAALQQLQELKHDGAFTTALTGLTRLRMGLVSIYSGDSAAAHAQAEALEALAAQVDRPGDILALHADLLSLVLLSERRLSEAITVATEGIRLYSSGLIEPQNAAYVRNVRGLSHLLEGRAHEAEEDFRAGLEMSARLRTPRTQGFCAFNLAWAAVLSGDLDAALTAVNQAVMGFLEDGGPEVPLARAVQSGLRAARHEGPLAALEEIRTAVSTSPHPELYQPAPTDWDRLGELLRT